MLQISITTDRAHLDRVEEALLEHGALSITLRDAADDPVLEPLPGETPVWPRIIVTGLFSAGVETEPLRHALHAIANENCGCDIKSVAERDWARACLNDFKPLRFGTRLRILPTTYDEPDGTKIDIRLDAGLAFGTGTHPTTALCLEWLDANPPVNARIIDYGCGSGILAIAALKLGARRALAVDIDPQALLATRANAARNGIGSEQMLACHPSDLPCTLADLLLANILARPLIELAKDFASCVKSGGKLVLSGLLQGQIDESSAVYAPWFEFCRTREKEGWVLLEGTRR